MKIMSFNTSYCLIEVAAKAGLAVFTIYKTINDDNEDNTGFVTRVTRPVPLVEQELLTFPEHIIFLYSVL